jgi:hypothetical protein
MPYHPYHSHLDERERNARRALDAAVIAAVQAAIKAGLTDDDIVDVLMRPMVVRTFVTCDRRPR